MGVKLHIEQAQRSNNFRIQSEITERVAVTKEKGQNSFTKGKTRECFQWKANGSCSKGDSCSFIRMPRETERHQPKERRTQEYLASDQPLINERKRKGKEQASSSVPTGQGQTDDKRSKSLEPDLTGVKIPCQWGARCGKSSCDYRHPPVCRNYKSGNRCIRGNNCLYRHADDVETPSKRSKCESTQGAVAILKENKVQGCASQNSDPKKSILRKAGNTRLNASAGHARGVIQKGEPHDRNPCAPTFGERALEETSRQEEYAQKAAWNLARNI